MRQFLVTDFMLSERVVYKKEVENLRKCNDSEI